MFFLYFFSCFLRKITIEKSLPYCWRIFLPKFVDYVPNFERLAYTSGYKFSTKYCWNRYLLKTGLVTIGVSIAFNFKFVYLENQFYFGTLHVDLFEGGILILYWNIFTSVEILWLDFKSNWFENIPRQIPEKCFPNLIDEKYFSQNFYIQLCIYAIWPKIWKTSEYNKFSTKYWNVYHLLETGLKWQLVIDCI